MLYAVANGEKTAASPNRKGICPGCSGSVISKCGEVKSWHWAHVANIDCDPWHECETKWHLDWKSLFPKESVEITLGPHRADVILNSTVFEFQNSPITPAEIREREQFYCTANRLHWIFNAQQWHIDLRRNLKPDAAGSMDPIYWKTKKVFDAGGLFYETVSYRSEDAYAPGPYRSFRWKWPHRSLEACSVPIFFDVGQNGIFEIKKIHWSGYVGGWGYLVSKQRFVESVTGQVSQNVNRLDDAQGQEYAGKWTTE